MSKIMDAYIHFSVRKFQPLNLVTLLGDEFNAKQILTQYVQNKSLAKIVFDADKKKRRQSMFKSKSVFYDDIDQMEVKEM